MSWILRCPVFSFESYVFTLNTLLMKVTTTGHHYFKDIETREEGGTPAIVGSIRAGLAMQLKEAIGSEKICAYEEELCKRVLSEWKQIEELVVVGPHSVSRLPVLSFLIRHPPSGRYLHHAFVCTLLNDLFGIQARGGCACAGPYAQVHKELDKQHKSFLLQDCVCNSQFALILK